MILDISEWISTHYLRRRAQKVPFTKRHSMKTNRVEEQEPRDTLTSEPCMWYCRAPQRERERRMYHQRSEFNLKENKSTSPNYRT